MSQPRDSAPHPSAIPAPARAYQGRRAGVVSRTIASVVDMLVVVGILAAVYGITAGIAFLLHPRSFHIPAGLGWSIPVIAFVIVVPYLTLTWHATGRSYGDALLGLRVVNRGGGPIRFTVALLRAVLCVLFPIGLFWVIISRANRSVQDIVMRTSVVYDWTSHADVTVR